VAGPRPAPPGPDHELRRQYSLVSAYPDVSTVPERESYGLGGHMTTLSACSETSERLAMQLLAVGDHGSPRAFLTWYRMQAYTRCPGQ
jgi:hypothetical protein